MFDFYNKYYNLSRRHCFLILLLFNVFIAFVYYVHEQNQLQTNGQLAMHTKNYTTKTHLREMNHAIEYIKSVLDNEYNNDDLRTFYNLVDTEFTLGLRCMRKNSPSSTTTSVNLSINASNHSNMNSVSSITQQSSRSLSFLSRRHHRKTLFSFLIDNAVACVNETIDLLIIIISKSDNYKTRDAIRRTWGSAKNLGNYSSINIKIFFLIDYDDKLSTNIRLENDLFHDIIQVELPQQYTLVTYRVLSLFEWSFRYCRQAKFLFKTDDDIFINIVLLLKFISPFLQKNTDKSFHVSKMGIYGYRHYHPGVFRNADDTVGSRYVITIEEFPCTHYPDFLSGFGYLIPKKARDALVYASYQDPDRPFRISDVYLTGILPDYLSLERHPMSDYSIRYQGSCDNYFQNPTAFACAAGLHHGDTSDVFGKFNRYWQQVKKLL